MRDRQEIISGAFSAKERDPEGRIRAGPLQRGPALQAVEKVMSDFFAA